MGFPGLLNTLGTLLSRSQTIKHIFKTSQMEGPMGPRGLGPKTIKLLKSLKIMKSLVLFNMEKMRIMILRREHWTRAPDHWYGHFGNKLRFRKIAKTCQYYQHRFNFGSKPCAWPLGYGRWLDSSKPLVLGLRRALRGFFFGKKGVWKSNYAYLLEKDSCICFV